MRDVVRGSIVLDWVHFLLCLGVSTGMMMEIKPWGGQHKHKHPEGPYPRFAEKGKRGSKWTPPRGERIPPEIS